MFLDLNNFDEDVYNFHSSDKNFSATPMKHSIFFATFSTEQNFQLRNFLRKQKFIIVFGFDRNFSAFFLIFASKRSNSTG